MTATSKHRGFWAHGVATGLVVCIMGSGAVGDPPQAAPASPSALDEADWLRLAPGDLRFYAELRDLEAVRRRFRELGIWEAVRAMTEAGKPGRPATLAGGGKLPGWDQTDMLISLVLGERSALLAGESSQWQQGLVLSSFPNKYAFEPLLQIWQGQRLPDAGSVQRYSLAGGTRLAVRGRTLLFGPAEDPEGHWEQAVKLLGGQRASSLAGRSEVAALRARLTREYPGLLYVAWAAGDPYAFAGCQRLLLGVDVGPTEIVCEIRGQRRRDATSDDAEPSGASLLPLPDSTFLAWGDSRRSAAPSEALPRPAQDDGTLPGFLRMMLTSLDARSGRLISGLGPRYLVAVDAEDGGANPGPRLPRLALVCETRWGPEELSGFDQFMSILANWLAALARRPGEPAQGLEVASRVCEGVELHTIAVGPTLARRLGIGSLVRVELVWALLDGRLLICTSVQQAESLIRVAKGRGARWTDLPPDDGAPGSGGGRSPMARWACAKGQPLAGLLRHWLNHFERERPMMMTPEWWRDWAARASRERLRLGVGLIAGNDPPGSAIVREIEASSPASGLLELGDVIVTAAGAPLPAEEPAREVARRYEARGAARSFEVEVLRAGQRRRFSLAVAPAVSEDLADFDPVGALRQAILFLGSAERISTWQEAGRPERFDAHLVITLRKDGARSEMKTQQIKSLPR